jgi:hypothetical protein
MTSWNDLPDVLGKLSQAFVGELCAVFEDACDGSCPSYFGAWPVDVLVCGEPVAGAWVAHEGFPAVFVDAVRGVAPDRVKDPGFFIRVLWSFWFPAGW